jgi:branched-chain amino acid aminotransferase
MSQTMGKISEIIWSNGSLGAESAARTRLTSETATRGVNAFEGIRAYWQQEHRRFAVVGLDIHLDRLRRSLDLLSLPAKDLVAPLRAAVSDLLTASAIGSDYYIRPMIYLEAGSYTDDPNECSFGSCVSIRRAVSPPPIACTVSPYRHVPNAAFPSRAKSGAAYSMFRLARIEAASRGYDEAILLDDKGFVTETGGASVFIVKDGIVMTPDLSHAILESVTRRYAITIVRERLGLSVIECAITAEDLANADAIFLAGTLDEIRIVQRLDSRTINTNGVIGTAARDGYLEICRGYADPLTEQMLVYVTTNRDHPDG